MDLPKPARYFPPRTGKYDVKPSLLPLSTDFGNGAMDGSVFQFDAEWFRFRENKKLCRSERLDKYVFQTPGMDEVAQKAVGDFLRSRLCAEYPEWFAEEAADDEARILACRLTGESLVFDCDGRLQNADNLPQFPNAPPYANAWDALCCQFPEDLAVVRVGKTGDEIIALHLCSASHWRGEDKIGLGFVSTHVPVPGMEKVSAASGALLRGVMERGPFVRFTWGIEFDDRLNHHPDAPQGVSSADWNRRVFDLNQSVPAYLRVERQVMYGLPDAGVFLFAIRVYHTDLRDLRPEEQAALTSALSSMSPASRDYKSLDDTGEAVADWLQNNCPAAT